MSTFIPKETVMRLLKDVKNIMKSPLTDNGIYYIHDETDMMKGRAMIVGPPGTPYFGGYYFFTLFFPNDYPHSPPTVTSETNRENIRFNPNLYTDGKVCVSLLNTWHGDQWTSCQSISSVLLTLCTLFTENPLLNEPGVFIDNVEEVNTYNTIITFANLKIAVCDAVLKMIPMHLPLFEGFRANIVERFEANYPLFLEFAERKQREEFATPVLIDTVIYSMKVYIDYAALVQKLKRCKEVGASSHPV